ncbi:iron ABC transporter permease [Rhizobiaceae bacterium BDR2-2]|uniref:Iron ABC transporter permease n=1 Tax=Ectorhizobium quercum TaxID=2965071 RepID=A0AAE3MZG9_9HYPH|nr:lipocalin-like domain-containing protein [Ectorhizobium quercum]MCX8998163.1 iron ABC transporter permease [Ectorhizobium quercum]
MNVRDIARKTVAAAAFLIWGCAAALAQGFAGLGGDAQGFAVPERGTALAFPRDHGPHPEFRIEWWYVTAVLKGEDGRDYGAQWTLFRSAAAPRETEGWSSPQLWMGHAGLTTPDAHHSAERLSRGGTGEAGATAQPFAAWIDEWRLAAPPGAASGDALDRLDMAAGGGDFRYDLTLEAKGPLVRHGDGGYSVKSQSGQASYYYSQPFYEASGTIEIGGRTVSVTGKAWLDREWSSQPLAADQTGWDWFSLHFETGDRMMGFRLRQRDGGAFTSGTWIAPDGTPSPLGPDDLKLTPQGTATVAGRTIPVVWRVQLPARGLDVTVRALNDAAWMDGRFPYWEGPVRVTGSLPGEGYLEMTGYE